MTKHKTFLHSLIIISAIIISISLANIVGGKAFHLFYNLIYGVFLSTVLPLWFVYREHETLQSLGVKKLKLKQIIVILTFVVFSIGGQLISLDISTVKFELLFVGFIPLIMTTFFEEFLFRGYIQTRLEKQYGWVPAVLMSGFLFSVYHLGYPGFRTINDILLLFVVGIGFALAFKLSDGNVIVSYLVNLPNAFLTYILKSKQFPIFNIDSTIFASITIISIIIIVIFVKSKLDGQSSFDDR